MKIRVIKLGTVCTDRATELEGTLTHWGCDMGKQIRYLFQPKGINPETGAPVSKIEVAAERLELPEGAYEDVNIPFEVLGSQVTDKASGFSGMATEFVRHINGCFHVTIQPAGVIEKTNTPVRRHEFDLRECKGDKIPDLNEEEKRESEQKHPSPTGDSFEDLSAPTESSFE